MNDIFILKTKDSTSLCSPNPCKNGGTCVVDADGYFSCVCRSGCYGYDCSNCSS